MYLKENLQWPEWCSFFAIFSPEGARGFCSKKPFRIPSSHPLQILVSFLSDNCKAINDSLKMPINTANKYKKSPREKFESWNISVQRL